jgi:hypothetical protein
MGLKITISHTDQGAATTVFSDNSNATKYYPSWEDALKDGERLGLLNTVEATAAKAMPPGLPMHTTADLNFDSILGSGFHKGQPRPPQA